MAQLARNIEEEIQTLAQSEYRLHAVFHHEGMATFGHYWVYIFDHQKGSEPRWIKYSDETVTEIRLVRPKKKKPPPWSFPLVDTEHSEDT